MKKIIVLSALIIACGFSANAQLGKVKIDTKKLGKAAENAFVAYTLTDAQVAEMAQEYIDWMDANNPECKSNPEATNWNELAVRFDKLVKGLERYDGLKLDFKLYCVIEENAFACPNGSVRVLAGLMDVMTDEEILGIIGHEIGHIKNGDSKDAMKSAYKTMAAKELIGSTDKNLAKLTDGQFGALGEALIEAQYSQKQEYAADDYGYKFLKDNGYDPAAMASALRKIEQMSASLDKINQFFSSHPDSGKRAQRLEDRAGK